MSMLSKNISEDEMRCKCGCGLCKPHPTLISMLQSARDIANIPFRYTSGGRCQKHNKAVGGKPDSDHLPDEAGYTRGADIKFDTARECFIIIKALIKADFNRIGINFKLKFIHVGWNPKNPQDVLFSY